MTQLTRGQQVIAGPACAGEIGAGARRTRESEDGELNYASGAGTANHIARGNSRRGHRVVQVP